MTPTEARDTVLNADEATRVRALQGWHTLCDEIHKRALATRPLLKSFEVHHSTESARAAYLVAFAEGKTEAQCFEAGMTACGLAEGRPDV